MLPTEVLDRMALHNLVSAYGHGIDRRDYTLLRSLYHDDATDDHSPYFCGSATDYVAWLPSMLSTWSLTSHVMSNMLFLIDNDRAEGVVSARAWHRSATGTTDFIAWGRYADRYEKRDGIWRFAHRFFILDVAETREVVPSEADHVTGVAVGRAGPDDPSLERLPLLRADWQAARIACARRV
jgi:hypothetical protein